MKGLAIRTIILILLGVLVLVFLTYWFYKGSSPEALSFAECNAKWIRWCFTCKNAGWTGLTTPTELITECCEVLQKNIPKSGDPTWCVGNTACNQGNMKSECKTLFGLDLD